MTQQAGPRPPRVALVTGAGTGIGRAVSVTLARHGYAVALAGRRREKLDGVAREVERSGGAALAVVCDVTDAPSVAALFERVRAEFSRIDLLFNNAGAPAPNCCIEEVTPEQWRAVLDTNLTGAFLCAQGAIRLMKAQRPQGGRIINNGSVSAHAPRPNSAPYTASKHAITGLTKSISLDCRRHGIACGQIDIGNALTEMAAGMPTGALQADGQVRVEPTIDVQLVADTVLHMAGLPLEANIPFVTLMANGMPYIGRG